MRKKLEVFLSSAQKEFEKERISLAKIISECQFLNCTLLEQSGANPATTLQASLEGVRESDIYVGIFGDKFSEITKIEYEEAVKLKMPCFIYVRKNSQREEALDDFIENIIKPQFKFHPFKTKTELYTRVIEDLYDYLQRILKKGLIVDKKDKTQAITTDKEEHKEVKKVKNQDRNLIHNLIDESRYAFSKQDYITSVVRSAISVEVVLRVVLKREGVSQKELGPIGFIVARAQQLGLLNVSEVNKVLEIFYIRNGAIHLGKIPTKDETKWALKTAENIIDKFPEMN